jgi:2-methylisocitrate lyase-like PEP mutase family enzyme
MIRHAAGRAFVPLASATRVNKKIKKQTMPTLRQLHREQRPLISPLAHDALSARLIERAGFKAFNIGGSSLLAARHALPDLGLAGFGEMAAGIRDIVEACRLPCLVDGDDGYGDVKSVTRMVQTYEAMGVGGLLLEDQTRETKQPGATAARGVVPLNVMEQKLRAALAARRDNEFVIIGRTDSLAKEGLDAALRRAEHFVKLGADGVFIAGLRTVEQYERVGAAFRGVWNAAALFQNGGQTPWISPQDLHAMGFSQVCYPNILIGRVAKALQQGLDRLTALASGNSGAFADSENEMAIGALNEAIGLQQWNEVEARFSEKENAPLSSHV